MKDISVAIVGATGLVGTTLLQILAERGFPMKALHLVASQQSSGKTLTYAGHDYTLQDLEQFDFNQTNLAFFCVSNDLAAKYVPQATAAGNLVIDKSFFFRNHDDVPLIVPEVNLHALSEVHQRGIIANPNCSTIPIAVALKPIYDRVGIERINIATYQSVSGTGKDAIAELTEQTKQSLSHQPIHAHIYAQQIAFNVLPCIDDFQENGYTREEMKMVWELKKIFNDHTMAINPTAVRVPVYCGHAASLHIETKEKLHVEEATSLLATAAGVRLLRGQQPPTPVVNAAGTDEVYVGRVREDISHPRGLNLWIVADNLRKGAALNAVQIAENLMRQRLL